MREKCLQFSETGTKRCVFVLCKGADGFTLDNPEDLRIIKPEPNKEFIILVMNTDDLLGLYTGSARLSVNDLEVLINTSFQETSRNPADKY